jgi:hypothetical protein|tara:strand:+ start:119 stop:472 length:354 start_codon:yes stop_codon:yes gene_type:complete
MTLRVDLSKIKDYQSICYSKEVKEQGTALNFFNLPYAGATNYLVLGAGAIGIGEITEDNYKEVFARHQFLQKGIVTLDAVKKHIGLQVNVANETTGRWLSRIAKSKFQEILWNIDNE